MMNVSAFIIPGLAMLGNEFSVAPGVVVLENPEMANEKVFGNPYTIEDIAAYQLQKIVRMANYGEPLKVYGFSMGGMVLSVLVTKYRNQLPKQTQFIFLLTSANTRDLPAISDETLAQWARAKPGDTVEFYKIIELFFSEDFVRKCGDLVDGYVRYRAFARNGQSGQSLVRQINAIRRFDGEKYFKALDPKEVIFVGGASDRVLGPRHNQKLKQLQPHAIHIEIENLGHMINIEIKHNRGLKIPTVCEEVLMS